MTDTSQVETCDMRHGEPYDFAWCETHDTTFPLGEACKFNGRVMWEVYAEEADEQRQRAVLAELELERHMDTLDELRGAGNARRARWHHPETVPWTGADWSNAMCGEAGEAANIVKKLRRLETGMGKGDRDTLICELSWELADTIAYADLLAQHYNINLRHAIADKFNIVSEREGFPERMRIPDDNG